ncbi:MAG: sulfotransferase domain-containing protein [Desulfobulbaceae bacterium]|nr:MAG: sulfotransferase domain-containing protein [Desulfobulbaceae bacterium]
MLLDNKDGLLQKAHVFVNAKISAVAKKTIGMEQSHIVICGFPRSGTSLLYNMVSATVCNYKATEFEKYAIHYLHKIGNYITKAPMDVLHVKHFDALNTNHKKLVVLLVVRDIRDILTSRHPIHPEEYFIGYDHSWWPQDNEFRIWGYDAPGVVDVHEAMSEALRRADVMLIRYEHLVQQPDSVQEGIKDRFSLEFKGKFHEYHQKREKHAYRYEGQFAAKEQGLVMEGKKVSSARIARWKKDARQVQRVRRQFEECPRLFEILEFYGYERDRSWFREIAS